MAETDKPANAMVSAQQNQIAIYAKMGDPMAYWTNQPLAKAAASLLRAPIDQGPAILMHAHSRGVDIFSLARDYDWILGKPTMKSAAMLSNFRLNYGGDYEVIESNANRAAIRFVDSKGRTSEWEMKPINLLLSRWPWTKEDGGWRKRVVEVRTFLSQGKSEKEIWVAMQKYFGDNYGTEEDWENMLWSRLISKVLKKICPELSSGIYTPEEMRDVEAIDVPFTTTSTTDKPLTADEFLAQQAAAEAAIKGEVVDAEFEVVDDQPKTEAASEAPVYDPSAPGTISDQDREMIEQLFEECCVSPENRSAALAKRHANVVRNLSANDAAGLLANLRTLLQKNKQQQAAAAGN